MEENNLIDKKIELFQVEELEDRFELKPWVEFDVVINVSCIPDMI